MKKLSIALLAVMGILLGMTSCSEDAMLADNLNGEWEGTFGHPYYEYVDRYGNINTAWAWNTYLIFESSSPYSTHGTGIEADFYKSGPYDYINYRFRWEVRNGTILLEFYDNSDMDLLIDWYEMTRDRFMGEARLLADLHGATTNFNLFKISHYEDYWDRTDFDYDYDYYYAATRAANTDTTAITPSEEGQKPKIIRLGRVLEK